MQEWVVVEDEGLQVDQAPHLWWETLQLVVAQVQVEQVRQVDEELVGDGVDAVGIWGNSGPAPALGLAQGGAESSTQSKV